MAILEIFPKQPIDVQDYDVSFVPWLEALGDTGASATVTCAGDLQIESHTLNEGVVKFWASGGTTRKKYVVQVTLTTVGQRVHQEEVQINVRDY